ncbi:MAG TPA: sorbosone dehydrogenase family protein [Nitrospira sp.]
MMLRLCTFMAAIVVMVLHAQCLRAGPLPIDNLKLPPGFSVTLFASGVTNARGMALGQKGTVFVGSRKEGRVYALVDENGDHKADKIYTLAKGLDLPVGVAYRNGSLYVSAVDRILRFDDIENHLKDPPKPVVIVDKLPSDKHHGWKYLAFGPDGKLYVAVGVPCNICQVDYARHGHIARMNPDGSGYEVVARGIRNSVGFDWNPSTKQLWFTDNGRDYLGDDQPPDELNHAPKDGLHFGYPYCHGKDISDPEFGKEHECSEFRAPAVELGPHVASLGMRFYTGSMFPSEYQGRIFIAEHGSWNRSKKIGYRITLVTPGKDGQWNYSVFAEGWLQGEQPWGRPVDILQMPDGSLLVSDDDADVIYRIAYQKTK